MFFHGFSFDSKPDKRLVSWFQKKCVDSSLNHKNLNPLIFTLQIEYPCNILRIFEYISQYI